MKLLLTSNGLSNKNLIRAFKSLFNKPLSEVKVLMISTGPMTEKIKGYINEAKEPLLKAGVEDANIDVLYMSNPEDINFDIYDVIFVCGGDTCLYLKLIRDLGLDEKIIKHVKSDKVYVGVSAGSYIACQTICLADFNGLGFIDFVIKVHYTPKLKNAIKELKKKYKSLIVLRDGEALLIDGNKKEIINKIT